MQVRFEEFILLYNDRDWGLIQYSHNVCMGYGVKTDNLFIIRHVDRNLGIRDSGEGMRGKGEEIVVIEVRLP